MRTSDICPTCSIFTNALCTLYNGAFLPTLDINTLESLESSLIKIEAWALANSSGTPTLQSVTTAGAVTTIGITVPSVQYDLAAAVTAAPGQFAWNADEETMNLGIDANSTLQLGQEDFYHVTNSSGADIADGTPVMAIGTSGASGRILIGPMDGSVLDNSKYFLGIATAPILNGANGKITKWGKVRDLDTTGTPHGEVWAEANIIYIDPTVIGGLTNVEPTAGMKLPIAFVIRAHATTGILAVRAKSGSGLHELHDVDVTGLVNGMHLQYNGTSGNWEVVTGPVTSTLQTVLDAGGNATTVDANGFFDFNLGEAGASSMQFSSQDGSLHFIDMYSDLTVWRAQSVFTGANTRSSQYRISQGTLDFYQEKDTFRTSINFIDPTADTTIQFPAKTIGTYTLATTSDINDGGYTVAGLPAGTTGQRSFVTDSNVVAAGNFGATVVGGGANIVPVFYNGTNWIIA